MTPEEDRALLEKVLAEQGVATDTSGPKLVAWLSDVSNRGLQDLLKASVPIIGEAAPAVAFALVLLVVAVGALVAVRLARRYRARGPGRIGGEGRVVPVRPVVPPTRAEVERRLGDGDVAGALATLWRWVAAGVEARGYARPSPDRTNRELLAEVRRAAPEWDRLPTLARLTDAVDGHLYAGVPVDAAAVRALLVLADAVVAPETPAETAA